jgi:hypothetical protein
MKRFFRLLVFSTLLLTGSLIQPAADASAQPSSTRFGVGFNGLLSTTDGLGLGIRSRISAPVNADLSFAVDLGLTGFILQGRDDASYVFDPQVSAIVTLPGRPDRTPYILGGVGAYVSFQDGDNEGGPTLHGGFGYVQALSETTIFYEINPALIIGQESVALALPFRIGVIF